ncbi:hypothetical protein QTP88_007282 [Uroleucon formosanum]
MVVQHMIKRRWIKWREASSVLCDWRISKKLKGKFCRSVVRPTMLYSLKSSADRRIEQSMNVTEMRMLRWMSGVTRENIINNEYVRVSIGVASIVDKVRENKLRWLGHVMRREETSAVRVVMKINIEGKRERGRPKKKWLENIEKDMRVVGVCIGDVKDRDKWRFRTRLTRVTFLSDKIVLKKIEAVLGTRHFFKEPKLCDSLNEASIGSTSIEINNSTVNMESSELCVVESALVTMNTKNNRGHIILTYEKDIGNYLNVENIDDCLKHELLCNPWILNTTYDFKSDLKSGRTRAFRHQRLHENGSWLTYSALEGVKGAFCRICVLFKPSIYRGVQGRFIIKSFTKQTVKDSREFLGFLPLDKLDAESVTTKSLLFMEDSGLNLSKFCGQGYDGCATMAGQKHVEELLKMLEDNRTNANEIFDLLFTDAKSIADDFEITITCLRITGKQSHRNNYSYESPKNYYRVSIFLPYLNSIIQCIKERFEKSNSDAFSLQHLHPALFIKMKKQEYTDSITNIYIFYKIENLFAESESWYSLWQKKDCQSMDIIDLLEHSKIFFPSITIALGIFLSLPATSCAAERSFSTLRRVKTWLRSTTGEDRLNGLCMLSVHRERVGHIFADEGVKPDMGKIQCSQNHPEIRQKSNNFWGYMVIIGDLLKDAVANTRSQQQLGGSLTNFKLFHEYISDSECQHFRNT